MVVVDVITTDIFLGHGFDVRSGFRSAFVDYLLCRLVVLLIDVRLLF